MVGSVEVSFELESRSVVAAWAGAGGRAFGVAPQGEPVGEGAVLQAEHARWLDGAGAGRGEGGGLGGGPAHSPPAAADDQGPGDARPSQEVTSAQGHGQLF